MPRSLTALVREAARAQHSDAWFGALLELSHPSLPTPLRFCQNNETMNRLGVDWAPYEFDVTLPETSTDRVAEIRLAFDNVDRTVLDQIIAIDDPIDVALYVATSVDASVVGPFRFAWREIQWTETLIEGVLRLEDFLNDRYPKDEFVKSKFPGLFR